MHRTPLFPVLFSLLVFIATVHLLATYFAWYWTIPWIDRIPHFSAGLLVGLTTLWYCFLSGYVRSISRKEYVLFLLAFLSAFLIGFLWELFELYFNITSLSSPTYFLNNGGDLLMDTAGGIIAYAYFSYKGFSRV